MSRDDQSIKERLTFFFRGGGEGGRGTWVARSAKPVRGRPGVVRGRIPSSL